MSHEDRPRARRAYSRSDSEKLLARHHQRSDEFISKFLSGMPPADMVGEFLASESNSTLSGVLLDSSTIEQSFIFANCKTTADPWWLSKNRTVVTNALVSLIEALVLHDRIVIGPGREIAQTENRKSSESPLKVNRSIDNISDDALFWIMSLAKKAAIQALGSNHEVFSALCQSLGVSLSREDVQSYLSRITVEELSVSLFKFAH
jgi:hypothetical protein